jgi:choline monooxygenase
MQCNWKFVFEQLECYHCPVLHPEAALAVDFRRRETQEYDYYHAATSYLDPRTDHESLLVRASKGDAFENSHVWYLWPNYMIVGRAGPANLTIIEAIPDGPEAVTVRSHYLLPMLPAGPENLRQMNTFRDVIWPQDGGAIESQQNGVKCRGYRPGRLMVDRERSYLSEHATHWFDNKVWQLHGATADPV